MKRMIPLITILMLVACCGLLLTIAGESKNAESKPEQTNWRSPMSKPDLKKLTTEEARVILEKGTEPAFTGKYTDHSEKGVYACRQCGALLYRSEDKFHSGCGWPAFDDEIPKAVKRIPDADGIRTEIVCATCNGHLGHVFTGEQLTKKNVRHCVNSISMTFIPADKVKTGKAVFAGGCFWGVEYYFQQMPGVLSATSGYTGGTVEHPDYRQVCTGTTGHAEAVEVVYDPVRINFETLAKFFFEIHDPTQKDRQGPDLGKQYRSAIFYQDESQKKTAEALIQTLRKNGMDVVTSLEPAAKFWPAETYHQDYYFRKGSKPYCHFRTRRDWN